MAFAHPAVRAVRACSSRMHFGFHDQLTLSVMSDTSVLYNSAVTETTGAKQTLHTMHKHSWMQQASSLQLEAFKEPGLT